MRRAFALRLWIKITLSAATLEHKPDKDKTLRGEVLPDLSDFISNQGVLMRLSIVEHCTKFKLYIARNLSCDSL